VPITERAGPPASALVREIADAKPIAQRFGKTELAAPGAPDVRTDAELPRPSSAHERND